MSHQLDVKPLTTDHGTPAVSILCPLDRRRPGNTEDAAVLTALRDRAVRQLESALDPAVATALIERVDAALASVDLQHPTPGVAVFVSPAVSRVIALDAPAGPEVAVGATFAIGDLVAAMLKRRRARILVLAQKKTRVVDLTGGDALERVAFGFPVEVEAPTEADTPHRDFPLDEHEHAEAAMFVFRAVDRALAELERHDPRPLVLVGADRDLAYFTEVSAHAREIVGRVRGNHERSSATDLAKLVYPALDAYEAAESQRVCDEVREAIGAHAVAGVTDTWAAACAGRGHRLIVEEGFHVPSHLVAGALEPARAGDPDAFDAVDATFEAVIRGDGDVVVVPPDSLSDVGHIALLTRY